MPIDLNRRRLLAIALAASAPGAWRGAHAATAPTATGANPFALGVASGPGAPGIVLWTHVAPQIERRIARLSDLAFDAYLAARAEEEARPAADIAVRWEVAADESFRTLVRSGSSIAPAALGNSVHVELQDLPPGRWFWYRFLLGDAVSAIGRARTPDARDAQRERLRFALASCQHYEHGYFGAYRHMRNDDPELVCFVGDYLYEGGPRDRRLRAHPFPAARTLFDYRLRHALYRRDADLQRMHAHCPWLLTWDDHEVSNDYAGDVGEEPAIDGRERRLAAYQAYYEHMPLPAAALVEKFAHVRLYRTHGAGQLASFIVLDDRQYRDRQACQPHGRGGSSVVDDAACPERRDPARTLLGREQLAWLEGQFAASRSRWNFIVQQTLFSTLSRDPGGRFWTDGWDGYPAERERVLAALDRTRLANPVLLGGDVHANWVCDVKRDFAQPHSAVVATEFCGTSISAPSNWDAARTARVAAANPHVRFGDSERRGYLIGEIAPEALTVRLRTIDDARLRTPVISTLAAFEVVAGRPGARRI